MRLIFCNLFVRFQQFFQNFITSNCHLIKCFKSAEILLMFWKRLFDRILVNSPHSLYITWSFLAQFLQKYGIDLLIWKKLALFWIAVNWENNINRNYCISPNSKLKIKSSQKIFNKIMCTLMYSVNAIFSSGKFGYPGWCVNAKKQKNLNYWLSMCWIYVRSTLKRSTYTNSTHSKPILHILHWI